MKRLIGLPAGLVLFGNVGLAPAAAGGAPPANLDARVAGADLEAGPGNQAVSKGIATRQTLVNSENPATVRVACHA